MRRARSLSLASVACLVLCGAVVAGGYYLRARRAPAERIERMGGQARRLASATAPGDRAPAGEGETPAEAGNNPGAAPAAGALAITGRLVKVAAAGGGAAGEAGLVPVEGAKLRLSLEPDDDDHDDDGDDDDGSAGTGPPTSFEPREATSGADGRFEITGLEAGKTFRLAADAPDRALLVLCIEIEEEASGTRFDLGDLVLDAPAALTVLVLDAEGEPVDGAHVRISPSGDLDKPVSHRLSSWFDGREAEVQGPGEYRFDRLGPGLHDVRCMAPGFTPPEHQEIALPRPEPLKIRLARGRLLAGRVLTSSGAPLAGAVVCIHNSWESPRELARSDAAGRFLLPGKDRGFMDTIEVRAPGFHKYSKDFHQGVDDVEIVLFRETTLSGRVVSALDGRPVARAEVSLETAFPGDDDDDGIDDARTDSEGRFAFRNLPPALYKLKTNHGEYIPAELGPLAAEEGAAVEDVIIKVVPGFALPGRVLDAGTGAAVPAARVSVNFRAERFGPSVLRSASTGPDGAFRLAAPARGKYYVTVKARDYLKFVAESFLSEEPARLDIELTKGGAIAGSVLDPDGRPVARADVLLAVPRDAPDEVKPDDMPLIRTDGAGRFRFGGLPRFPRYALGVDADGLAPAIVKDLEAGPGLPEAAVEVRLERPGVIRGKAITPAGVPIPDAWVSADLEEPEEVDDKLSALADRIGSSSVGATSGAGGAFEMACVAPQTYTVSAGVEGDSGGMATTVEVTSGQTVEGVEVIVREAQILRGRVVDPDGSGIAGAEVNSVANTAPPRRTDAEGRFSVAALPPSDLRLRATRAGFAETEVSVEPPWGEVTITLTPQASIRGRLEASGRTFLPRGRVDLDSARSDDIPSIHEWSESDYAGTFEFGLKAREYVLQPNVPGYACRPVVLSLAAGERRELNIPLSRAGALEGLVLSRETGEPVQRAGLHIESAGTRLWVSYLFNSSSDGKGRFLFKALPEGSITLLVTDWLHAAERIEGIAIEPGRTTAVRVELSPAVGVRGAVLERGRIVPGAQVVVRGTADAAGGRATSTTAGFYEVAGLAPGEYEVTVQRPEGAAGAASLLRRRAKIPASQFTWLDLNLGTFLVTGRVTANGAPVNEARVDAQSSAPAASASDGCTTDADGRFELELPEAGEYEIEASKDGYESRSVELMIHEGQDMIERDFELQPGG